MFLGKVIGNVWSSVKWPELTGMKLLLVRPYSLTDVGGAADPNGREREAVVCGDALGAGVGEEVIVAYGHAARVAMSQLLPDGAKPAHPIDAAVVAIVDRYATATG